jgi:pimeloyl-ACP methyl ester carboxylesterase
MGRSMLRSSWLALGLVASGCFLSSPTPPLRVVAHAGAAPSECLFVFLPGFGDQADTFENRGLVQTARELGCDSLATGAHFGFYREVTIVERLKADVIGPAQERGYDSIWMVGVSMGGFGALSYAEWYPDDVAGIVLLAPFLGDADVLESIAADGLSTEPVAREGRDEESETRAIWAWIANQLEHDGTPIFLGYGAEDGGAEHDAILGRHLPPNRLLTFDGGHDWDTWAALFRALAPRAVGTTEDRLLARSPNARRDGAGARLLSQARAHRGAADTRLARRSAR